VSRKHALIGPVALVLGLVSVVAAGQDMSAEEFAAKAGTLGEEINATGNDSPECLKLQQRADALVGRPQLRYAAMEEYRAICEGGNGPTLPTDNPSLFDGPADN